MESCDTVAGRFSTQMFLSGRIAARARGCREEKSQIQALDRTALILPMLVDRDHGTLGRVEVQADDVAEIGVIVAAELP